MNPNGGVILVGGEALFDVVAGDGDALEAHPGGGPFNAARTIARLDQPVAYLGRLSTESALEAVVDRLAGTDTMVVVDPNCRPHVINDPSAYRRRLRWILAHTHLVKVSEEDVAFLDPDRDPVKATRALLADGPSVGLLTRGGDGVVVVTNDRDVVVTPPPAKVVDTIGAGDAFAGGFLSWWRERDLGADALADLDTVVEAATFACLVAARTCERAGASPPYRR